MEFFLVESVENVILNMLFFQGKLQLICTEIEAYVHKLWSFLFFENKQTHQMHDQTAVYSVYVGKSDVRHYKTTSTHRLMNNSVSLITKQYKARFSSPRKNQR